MTLKFCNFDPWYNICQWVETNPSNIRICPMDICFAAWWYYADSIDTDVKYGYLQMLNWLVSTHLTFAGNTFRKNPKGTPLWSVLINRYWIRLKRLVRNNRSGVYDLHVGNDKKKVERDKNLILLRPNGVQLSLDGCGRGRYWRRWRRLLVSSRPKLRKLLRQSVVLLGQASDPVLGLNQNAYSKQGPL